MFAINLLAIMFPSSGIAILEACIAVALLVIGAEHIGLLNDTKISTF
ncbi:MAG: hypothetical protein K8U57_21210 [Planctomycetes bacterium]|nr:hypothetical protein [Planctomycetota bacterium]